MSIGSLGVIGSVAAGQLHQTRGADSDRAVHDALTQSRELDSARKAEAAEGIGETTQDEKTSDRDADGRRLWERAAKKTDHQDPSTTTDDSPAPTSIDPTGQSGANLDLLG
jgi:hypothetical protein